MGKVLNRFEMLKQYKDLGLRDRREDWFTFSLTGLLVHDEADHVLDSLLQQNLGTWGTILGKQLMLITNVAVDPSRVSVTNNKFTEFYKRYMIADASLDKDGVKVVNPLIRRLFNLPEIGSFLLLTDDLYADHFDLVPISGGRITECIGTLRSYCWKESREQDDYKKLISALCEREGEVQQTGKPVIDLLLDSLSLVFKKSDFENGEQTAYVKDLLERLRREAEGKEDAEERIFEISNYLANLYGRGYDLINGVKTALYKDDYLENIVKQLESNRRESIGFSNLGYTTSFEVNGTDHDKIEKIKKAWLQEEAIKNYDLLEEESKNLLFAFIYSKKALFAYGEGIGLNIPQYDGLTIFFGKILENEFYKSVGQMLRETIGIEMPKYYATPYPKFGGMSVPAGHNFVNLNTDKESIPLGELLCAYDSFLDRNTRSWLSQHYNTNFRYFKRLTPNLHNFIWNFVMKYRNKNAHIDLKSKETYDGASTMFSLFVVVHLKELYNIRQAVLSGK